MPKLNTIVPRLVWSFYYLVELHNCNEYQHQPGLSIVSWVHGTPLLTILNQDKGRKREKKAKPKLRNGRYVLFTAMSQNDQKQKSFCERKSKYFHMVDK
jgi:hypothetical protein